jgi:flagellar M-ring protein FliF
VAGNLKGMAEVWQRMSLLQRLTLAAILLGCAGACASLVYWARKPQMALLYSNLSPGDASKIIDKVRDGDTPYELKEGGTAVYVPDGKVYALRLAMAQQGLPASDQAGYRILDEERFGVSPFAQHVNYTRAIEGELARSISLIEGVAHARVHVVRPERTVLAKQVGGASATVVLQLKPGGRFATSGAAAIVHLVAGAVEGLSADKVVVVDSQGTMLSGSGNNQFAQGEGSFLDYKHRVEQYLSRKAEDMLSAVLGPGRASVRVDAVVEVTASNQTKETYDPAGKIVTHEKITKSSNTTPGKADESPGGTKEDSTESTYIVGKTTEQVVQTPGAIKGLTVAAFVDLTTPAEANRAGPALTIKDAEDIIRNACGMKPADTLKVVSANFYKSPESLAAPLAEAGWMNKDFLLEIAQRASLGILVIGALLALKIFGGKKASRGALAAALPAGASAGAGQSLLPAGEMDVESARLRITRALQEDPEEVKRLFLTWVESEKGEA